jgi:ferredoxin-type protein NapH
MEVMRKMLLFMMFLLLPVTLNYFSPYIIIDGLANGILSGAFFIWMLMLVTSLFFGRAFCSYVCPYGGLQMVADKVLQRPLKEVKWLRKVRYVLGAIWLGAIIFVLVRNMNGLKLDFFYLTESFISVDNILKLIGYYVIVFLLLILPFFLGKRASCQYLCPMAILNIIGTKIKNTVNMPSLRLQPTRNNCTNCKQCNKACPMSLNVNKMVNEEKMENIECILCGECCNACKFSAIKRVYGRKTTLNQVKDNNIPLK